MGCLVSDHPLCEGLGGAALDLGLRIRDSGRGAPSLLPKNLFLLSFARLAPRGGEKNAPESFFDEASFGLRFIAWREGMGDVKL